MDYRFLSYVGNSIFKLDPYFFTFYPENSNFKNKEYFEALKTQAKRGVKKKFISLTMSIYESPKFDFPKIKFPKFWQNKTFWLIILIIFISSVSGFISGTLTGGVFYLQIKDELVKLGIKLPEILGNSTTTEGIYLPQTTQEEAIIKVVKDVAPAVVSIVITKDVPIFEQYYVFEEFFGQSFRLQAPQLRQKGTEKKEIGGGTGFIISEDGMVLTNKHVALDEQADYTVFTNDGKKYPAKVLARDPLQDLAVLKISQEKIVNEQGGFSLKPFLVVKLGDSDKIQIGQTVVAIGNALGEFRNTISVGVISGLGRTITASGGGLVETLEDVIQTDAAINKGNSGGPLLNLKGEVIGVNAAMVEDAQSIGFAIQINKAKKAIEQVKNYGKIVYPFLGVRYTLITEKIQKDNNLSVDYGAWVTKGEGGEPAIAIDSAAQKAGLKENDIILELNGEKITADNTLAKVIMKYNVGDTVPLKILRNKEEIILQVTLSERNE
ncbi:MAG: trypsin-like peptidase domain-containing protein [bacterium]|nr:trypsin-like peptidase domain-containing protein [bacterium]